MARRKFHLRHTSPITIAVAVILVGGCAMYLLQQLSRALDTSLWNAILLTPLIGIGVLCVGHFLFVAAGFGMQVVQHRSDMRKRALYEQREERARKLRAESMIRIRDVTRLRAMDPRDFEIYVSELYQRLGNTVTLTPYSQDGGIDLVLADKTGKKIAVQIKRYGEGRNIGAVELQQFVGAHINYYDQGIFVTTSTFTAAAVEVAARHNIELIDYQRLEQLIQQVFPAEILLTTPMPR